MTCRGQGGRRRRRREQRSDDEDEEQDNNNFGAPGVNDGSPEQQQAPATGGRATRSRNASGAGVLDHGGGRGRGVSSVL